MDQGIALRCLLQRAPSPEASANSQTPQQKFALIPHSVTVTDLLAFILRQLEVKDPVKECSAKVLLPGWRTLSLEEICTDPGNTTALSLLGSLSNIAVLLIQLPIAPPRPLSVSAARRLIRCLLPRHTGDVAVQVDWLRKSGCPLTEADLSAYLTSPAEFVFAEATRIDFAVWRRRLRRLAKTFQPPACADSPSGCDVDMEEAGNEGGADPDSVDDDDDDDEAFDPDATNSGADENATKGDDEEGESGFGDEAIDGAAADEESRSSAQASLERLFRLSRVPRQLPDAAFTPAAAAPSAAALPAAAAAALTAAGKENSSSAAGATKVQAPPIRHRLFIDPHSEIPILERHYGLKPHPCATDCRRIADEMNSMPFRLQAHRQVQPKNVRLWFKNRRARARKVETSAASESAPPVTAAAAAVAPSGPPPLVPLLPHPSPLTKPPVQLHIRMPIVTGVSSSTPISSG